MTANEIQNIMEEYYYWDMPVNKLDCNYFADEITIVYDDSEGNDVYYFFKACYKANFDHVKSYDKLRPVRDMTKGQMPYFLQDIRIGETVADDVHFYTCNINMFPLYLEIWCKEISVNKVPRV